MCCQTEDHLKYITETRQALGCLSSPHTQYKSIGITSSLLSSFFVTFGFSIISDNYCNMNHKTLALYQVLVDPDSPVDIVCYLVHMIVYIH